MRAIEKFAAKSDDRIMQKRHGHAHDRGATRKLFDDRQRRRDRGAASGITFATIGAEISAVARVSILCSREKYESTPSVPNVVDDPYQT